MVKCHLWWQQCCLSVSLKCHSYVIFDSCHIMLLFAFCLPLLKVRLLLLSLFCRTLSSMNFSGTLSPRIGVLKTLSTLCVWIILDQSVYNLSYTILFTCFIHYPEVVIFCFEVVKTLIFVIMLCHHYGFNWSMFLSAAFCLFWRRLKIFHRTQYKLVPSNSLRIMEICDL